MALPTYQTFVFSVVLRVIMAECVILKSRKNWHSNFENLRRSFMNFELLAIKIVLLVNQPGVLTRMF